MKGCLRYHWTSVVFPRNYLAWTSAKYQFPSGFSTTKPHSNKFPKTPRRLRTSPSFFQLMPWTAYATLLTSGYKRKEPFESNFSALTLMEDLGEKESGRIMQEWSLLKGHSEVLVGSWSVKLHNLTDGHTGRATSNSVVVASAAATKATPWQAGLTWDTRFRFRLGKCQV